MKKLLLIITMLVLGIGSTWAAFEDITVYATQRITNLGGKYYTIHYKFTNGNTYPVIVEGTTLKCANTTSATPAVFYFNLADDKGFYKVKETSTNTFWKFDRNLGSKDDAVNIQIFSGQNDGTYRICGLTTDEDNNKNSRCYLAEGNGNALNYNSREWANNAENGKISVQVASNSGTYCSEVVLTEVFVEAQALTSGWYRVRVSNSGDITQNYITTKEENIAEGDYPAKSASQGTNIGATFMYFEVGNDARNDNGACGKWIHVRDSKGRYMTREATSSISAPNQICCVYSSSSAKQKLVFTNGTDSGTDKANTRYSWQAYNNYIGLSAANTYNIFYAAQAGEDYINNAYKVKVLVGADGSETISYNGTETHYGFNTVYNNGTFFFAQGVTPSVNDFIFDKGNNNNYGDNVGIYIDTQDKTININPSITVPDGYNGYIGDNTSINETEWKTRENWCLSQAWSENNGPGTVESNMYYPIYLKDVNASGMNLEGWNLQLKLENSKLTATTKKMQTGISNGAVNYVDENSTLDLTFAESGNNEEGTYTFNIDGTLTMRPQITSYQGDKASATTINLGTHGKFYFTAVNNNNVSTSNAKSFTINVTPTEPAKYNEVEPQTAPFAVIQNVTFADGKLTFGTTNAKWERVDTYADLSNQTATGEHFYYFIEESEFATGEKKYKLYTYKQKIYSRNVTSGNFGSICIPNAVEKMDGIEKVLAVTEVGTDRVVMDVVNVDKMVAGVPYIFKSNDNSISLTLNGETVTEPNNNTQDYLVGNFSPVTVPTSDQNTSYYVLQSNKFKKVTSASSITSGSNRCYLKVPATSQSRLSTLGISVDEDGATGIDALNALINNNAEIYDINGRKLKDLRKGINIVNGVKVIVK